MSPGFDSALVESLQKLLFFERASAHVLAGCLPKIRSFELKRIASRDLYDSMSEACRLREQLFALGHRSPDLLVAAREWIDAMRAVDALPDAGEALFVLYMVVRPAAMDEYARARAQADRLIHAPLIEASRAYLAHARPLLRRAQKAVRAVCDHPPRGALPAAVQSCWAGRNERNISLDDALWGPLERAPAALRPAGLNPGLNGTFPLRPVDVLRDRKSIGIYLHNNVSEEYATLELMGRNSYEHPDMPWPFHLSMARQAWDEARHAEMQERLAARYGVRYGDYPVYVTSYDMMYAFDPCPEGGKRELLWRLLLRSTYQEALSLDSMLVEIERRRYLDQEDVARVFHYLLADELFHVENGLRWTRTLGESHDFNVMVERDLARDYFLALEEQERLRFILTHPQEAIAEGRRLEQEMRERRRLMAGEPGDLPIAPRFSAALRRKAGFSEDELGQDRDWHVYE